MCPAPQRPSDHAAAPSLASSADKISILHIPPHSALVPGDCDHKVRVPRTVHSPLPSISRPSVRPSPAPQGGGRS
jgi:hypothetical protein